MPYILNSRAAVGGRVSASSIRGQLLRYTNSNGNHGYSVLQSWSEFGDGDLEYHLNSFKSGQPTKLMQASLVLAERDLHARRQGIHLFIPDLPLRNNFLVTNVDELTQDQLFKLNKAGYLNIKIKAGRDIEREKYYVKKALESSNFLVRLDFNSLLTWPQFERFFSDLDLKRLEYVEDPFSYDVPSWTEARKLAKLALDFEIEKISWDPGYKPACDVLVVKPTRVNLAQVENCLQHWLLPFTVTSNMDHCVGIVHALSIAQYWNEKYPKLALNPGCDTLNFFEDDCYSNQIIKRGPFLNPPSGVGIGFQDLLEREAWQSIS